MLVADAVPGRPPCLHIRMLWLGREDAAEATLPHGVGAVIELELVHPLEVEGDRTLRSAELETERVLAPGREARRLEGGEHAIVESAGEEGDVVNGHRAALA